MASTARQGSYTNPSAWIQSTYIKVIRDNLILNISGTLTMYTAGSHESNTTLYVVMNIDGINYYDCGRITGNFDRNNTYPIPYSKTINLGYYHASSVTVGFYVSASSNSLSSSGTLIFHFFTPSFS